MDAQTYAVVDASGAVINVVLAGPDYGVPAGYTLVPAGPGAEPGGSYAGGVFAPAASSAPVATPYQIATALNVQGSGPSAAFDAALVKAKPSDRNRWKARTDPVPADNPVFVRVCAIASIDPIALVALAVQQ